MCQASAEPKLWDPWAGVSLELTVCSTTLASRSSVLLPRPPESSDCCPLSPDLYPKTLSKGPCLFLLLKKLIIRGLTSCHSLMSRHFQPIPGTPFWGLLFLFSCYFYFCSYKQFYYKHPCLCRTFPHVSCLIVWLAQTPWGRTASLRLCLLPSCPQRKELFSGFAGSFGWFLWQ